jgi:hypothetical protein
LKEATCIVLGFGTKPSSNPEKVVTNSIVVGSLEYTATYK